MTDLYATAQKILCGKIAQWRMRGPLGEPDRSRILMFHDIIPDDALISDEYACPLSTLIQIVTALRARGFSIITLDELLDLSDDTAARNCAVLTFDDGYESVFSLALPSLSALCAPFTVYITTDYLDQPGYLDRDKLALLAEEPLCTVGSHLVTHSMTRFLPARETTLEMMQSRAVLETITGKPVTHLAFPYGSAYACSLRDVRLAQKCGYRSAALTIPTAYDRKRPYSDFTLPRLNMPAQFR